MKKILILTIFFTLLIRTNAQTLSDYNLIIDNIKRDSTFKEYIKESTANKDSVYNCVEVIDSIFYRFIPNTFFGKNDTIEFNLLSKYSHFKDWKEMMLYPRKLNIDSVGTGVFNSELEKLQDDSCTKYLLFFSNFNQNIIFGTVTNYRNTNAKEYWLQTGFNFLYHFIGIIDERKVLLFKSAIFYSS